jgi:hypothetical protein
MFVSDFQVSVVILSAGIKQVHDTRGWKCAVRGESITAWRPYRRRMPDSPQPERRLIETFTGLVVESLAVKQDFGAATVGCRGCDRTLGAGDPVTVALSCYEDHSWEIEGVYCEADAVASVTETMAVRAEQQVVLGAVLEPTGYDPPTGNVETDALTLGSVEILDYSPTSDGY